MEPKIEDFPEKEDVQQNENDDLLYDIPVSDGREEIEQVLADIILKIEYAFNESNHENMSSIGELPEDFDEFGSLNVEAEKMAFSETFSHLSNVSSMVDRFYSLKEPRPVTTEADRQKALQKEYRRNCFQAYQDKDYKLCLLMLKKLTSTDASIVELSVNCAYDYWRYHVLASLSRPSTVLRLTDGNDGSTAAGRKAEVERDSILSIVKDAFSHLFEQTSSIQPYDYIRLTHIYLSEGSLEGALQILSLASARGYLECNLIIVQSWTIVSRIQSQREADKIMVYLTSAILGEKPMNRRSKYQIKSVTTENADQVDTEHAQVETVYVMNSSLPLAYVCLHCAVFQKKELSAINKQKQTAKIVEKKRKMMNHFLALLSEAYYLMTGFSSEEMSVTVNWFNRDTLWLHMGDTLRGTPFILLCEDSYWQCFLRAPLKEEPLRKIMESMSLFHREEGRADLLARAMRVNPWNVFCRQMLRQIEEQRVSDVRKRQWAAHFDQEDRMMTKILAHVRGWLARRRWPALKKFRMEVVEAFRRTIRISEEASVKAIQRIMIRRLEVWREYVYHWMWTKYNAATKIQTWARRIQCMTWYTWAKWRVNTANALYIVAAQRSYDMRRARPFRKWHDLFVYRRKQYAADLITKALQLSSYSTVLANAMEFLSSVLRVKRIHTFRRIFAWWHSEYHRKRRVHARISIRFFFRNLYRKRAERAKEARLQAKLKRMEEMKAAKEAAAYAAEQERIAKLNAANNVKVEIVPPSPEEMQRRSEMPLIKKTWAAWRAAYQMILDERTKDWLSKRLAMMFKRQRARRVVRYKRPRLEGQEAFVLHHWWKVVARIFLPWKFTAFSYRIQRCARMYLARKALRRLQHIKRYMRGMKERRRIVQMKKIFHRIEKNNYLVRREKIRASKWIVLLFRKIMHRAALREKVRRKIRMFRLTETFHLQHLKFNFKKLKYLTIYSAKLATLNRYFSAVLKGARRAAFSFWLHQTRKEALVARLLDVFVTFKIERTYWVGACTTVTIKPIEKVEEDLLLLQQNRETLVDTKPYEAVYKRWEQYRSSQKILHSFSINRQLKAFRCWLICFRLRNRYKRGSSRMISQSMVDTFIDEVTRRRVSVLCIQRMARCASARLRIRALKLKALRREECCVILHKRHQLRVLRVMWMMTSKKCEARLRLQRFIRFHFDRKQRKRVAQRVAAAFFRVKRSDFQRVTTARLMHRMQVAFCQSALQRTSGSNHQSPTTRKQGSIASTLAAAGYESADCRLGRGSSSSHSTSMRKSSSAPRLSKTTSTVTATLQDAYAAWSDEERAASDDDAHKAKDYVAANRTVRKALSKTAKAEVLRDQHNMTFKSAEFQSHLFRLKQSGVFVFDSQNVNKALVPSTKDIHKYAAIISANKLFPEEVEFFLARADTVLCHHVNLKMFTTMTQFSIATKVFISEGYLSTSSIDALALLSNRILLQQQLQIIDQHTGVSTRAAMKLHISTVRMRVSTVSYLAKALQTVEETSIVDSPPKRTGSHSTYITSMLQSDNSTVATADDESTVFPLLGQTAAKMMLGPRQRLLLTELVLDVESCGALGISVLLTSLQWNDTVRLLVVKSSEGRCLSCYEEAFKALSQCTTLQEFRLLGAVMTPSVTNGLLHGVMYGFKALTVLEFAAGPESEDVTRHIVLSAKDRSYAGRQGLSVIVNSK